MQDIHFAANTGHAAGAPSGSSTTHVASAAATAQPRSQPPSAAVPDLIIPPPSTQSTLATDTWQNGAEEPQSAQAQQAPPQRQARRVPRSPRPFWTLSPSVIARRLFTRFDFLHLHAASGTLHLVYGVPRCLWIFYSTAILHETVQPWAWELPLVVALYIVKDLTAVPLTLTHRRGAMRSLFLVAGFLEVSNWAIAVYLCPEYTHLPDIPDGAARTMFALVATAAAACAANAAATTGGVVGDARGYARAAATAPDVAESRRRGRRVSRRRGGAVTASATATSRRAQPSTVSIYDSPVTHIFYAACQIIPAYLLFVPAWGIALGGADARAWMLDAVPDLQTLTFDVISVSNLFGSIGIFAGTLQARLLISVYTTHALLALQLTAPLLFVVAQCMTCDARAYATLFAPYFLLTPLPWEF